MSDKTLAFSTDDVVITEDGRVTINNPEFAKRLVAHAKMVSPAAAGIFDNCDCKKGAVSEVALGKVLPATTLKVDAGRSGIFDNCDCKSRMPGAEVVRD